MKPDKWYVKLMDETWREIKEEDIPKHLNYGSKVMRGDRIMEKYLCN